MDQKRRYLVRPCGVFLRGIMEAPCMDADKPKLHINLDQHERDQARALYAVDFDMARAGYAADKAQEIDENDVLTRMRQDTRAFIKSYALSEDGRYWLPR